MPKSHAERQKAYLQRKTNENKKADLAKERERKRLARQKCKNQNGNAYKQYFENERARKKDSYKNKKDAYMPLVLDDLDSSSTSTNSTKYTVRSFSRATIKTKPLYQLSPEKRLLFCQNWSMAYLRKVKTWDLKLLDIQCMIWLDMLTHPRQQ